MANNQKYGKHGKVDPQHQSADDFRRPQQANDARHVAAAGAKAVQPGARTAGQAYAGAAVAAAQKSRKKRRRTKILAIVLSILVLAFAGVGVAAALYLNELDSSMAMSEEEKLALADSLVSAADDEPYYALLLGSDARKDDKVSRTDAIIIARIDAQNKKVTLVSIPRDTQVVYKGSKIKINAAYFYGGASGAVEAVSDFAGIKISHFALVHFDELRTAINDLGGIYIDVPKDFTAWNGVEFKKGRQLLKGKAALTYARERKKFAGGDFDRTSHQREVIMAMVDRIKEKDASELPQVIRDLAGCVSTDYSTMQLVALANAFISDGDGDGKIDDITFYSAMSPSTTGMEDGVSWTFVVEDQWKEIMAAVDAGKDPSEVSGSSSSGSSSSTKKSTKKQNSAEAAAISGSSKSTSSNE